MRLYTPETACFISRPTQFSPQSDSLGIHYPRSCVSHQSSLPQFNFEAVTFRRNTQAIVTLAGEKSQQARRRVIEAINEMREGEAITSMLFAWLLVFRRPSFMIPSTPISLNRSGRCVKSIHDQLHPNQPHQAKATRPKMRRLSASKSVSEHLRSKSKHCKKRTNCSTAN